MFSSARLYLHHQPRPRRPPLAPVNRRLRAPLGGEQAHTFVHSVVEAQHIADHAAIQQRAVGVGVGKIRRLQL